MHFLGFRWGAATPSVASFEAFACTVGNGIEVEIGYAVYSERHVRYALGDDRMLLKVPDPCHAEEYVRDN